MHKIIKQVGGLLLGVATVGGTLASCSEKIDESNLYTFTGETIADYLSNNEEFSEFNAIIKQAGLEQLLSAYGNYTCFVPTNAAVEEYLDSLYNDPTVTDNNGMSAPGLAGLTGAKGDSLCKDIAEYHLTRSLVKGIDMGNGVTIPTVLGRDLSTQIDPASGDVCINNYSLITQMDLEKENGYVHVINHVLRRSNSLIGGELENAGNYTIWTQALKMTGLDQLLEESTKEDGVGAIVETKDTKAYSLKETDGCKEGFTVFAEPDEVFVRAGITSATDLAEKAYEWYKDCAKSSADGGWYDYMYDNNIVVNKDNYTDQWNALNMFLRYHILPYSVSRDKLTNSWNEFTSAKLYEYNRTLLPHTLLKVSYDVRNKMHLINKGTVNGSLTSVPASLEVDEETQTDDPDVPGIVVDSKNSVNPLNGWIHPLKSILKYDRHVPYSVLNERLRFDDTSLLDEIMSNGFRGATKAELVTLTNVSGKTRIVFPTEYFRNMVVYNGSLTEMKYLVKDEGNYDNYQGDEFLCTGPYDFAIKIPSVPADGTYEIRIGYTAETARGMLQFYLGSSSDRTTMTALDIPLDMRIAPAKGNVFNTTTGWTDYRTDLDNGVATDQAMRNLGYMRGIRYYQRKDGAISGRERANCLRRIIYRGELNQGEHWLRFKTVLPEETGTQFHLDYIELVPQSVYNNPTYSEDIF